MKITTTGVLIAFFCGFFWGALPAAQADANQIALYRKTMNDIQAVFAAIENHLTDFAVIPDLENLSALERALVPKYLKALPKKDAWGNAFFFKADRDNPELYWIASGGSDGRFQGFDQSGLWQGWDGEDLVWVSREQPRYICGPQQ